MYFCKILFGMTFLMSLNDLPFRITTIIDILLALFLLIQLYRWLKGTAAIRIFIGVALIFALWKTVTYFEMTVLSEVLGQFISVGIIALIVVFQPEIRSFLLMLGNHKFFKNTLKFSLIRRLKEKDEFDVSSIVNACRHLANSKTGALIIIARTASLEDFIRTGEVIDANISRELIENIFFKNSPLHDGALLVVDHRLMAARCILPVSKDKNLSSDLGLRHRSAIGITQLTDAIAIVVSEQTGQISVSIESELQRDLSPSVLEQLLVEHLNLKVD